MRPLARAASVLALACATAAAQSPADVERRLHGSWTATQADLEGRRAAELVGQRLAFTAGRFVIHAADGRTLLTGSYRLAAGTGPLAIDLAHDERPLLSTIWRGIVAVDGDTLRYCENAVDLDAPRPTTFSPAPGSGELCITYRREPR